MLVRANPRDLVSKAIFYGDRSYLNGLAVPGFGFLGGLALFATGLYLLDTADQQQVTVLTIPKVGLPYTTKTDVKLNLAQLDSGRIPTVEIAPPTRPVPSTQPLIEKVELQLDEEYGRVVSLEGKNFGSNTSNDKLSVNFIHGGKEYLGKIVDFTRIDEEKSQVKVITDLVPLNGDESQIVVKRKTRSVIGTETEEETEQVLLPTPVCVELALVPKTESDSINVFNAFNPEQVIAQSQEGSKDLLLGEIPVGTEDIDDRPRHAAVTSNASRAYVPLEQSGRVAVVDVTGLQQLDTNPNKDGINPIDLPAGAKPDSIAIDPRDRYAYVGDRQKGAIYVIDINPFSQNYNKCIGTIEVDDAPKGLRKMAINSDGTRLFVTAPNSSDSGKGQILVFNIDPNDRPTNPAQNTRSWHRQIGKIEAGLGLEGIAATPDPLKMIFTNRNEDARGFGAITYNSDPRSFAATVKYAQLTLGSIHDYFDVNEAMDVAITNDGNYAFIAARNGRWFGTGVESIDGPKAGSNIGIIKDPLTNPKLVAATRPIPMGLTNGLALSSNDKYLYAAYPGVESTFAFDVEEIIKTVNEKTAQELSTTPIDEFNPLIDIAADLNNEGRPQNPKNAPLATIGQPNSVAMASSRPVVNMLTPLGVSNEQTLTPTFRWNFDGQDDNHGDLCASPVDDDDVLEVNLYISVFPEDLGLLPEDRWEFDMNSEKDYNPNRILTATWTEADDWTLNGQPVGGDGNSKYQFTLPEDRMLTAGQKYYWAVKVKYNDGRVKYAKTNQSFEIELPSIAQPKTFSSVTVLTRGLEREGYKIDSQFYEIANHITRKIGPIDQGGLVMRYNQDTGNWSWRNSSGQWVEGAISEDKFGTPLVLIPGWEQSSEATAFNSGFAEAAADALFASLVDLNQDLGNDALFNSRMHFVGVGQGAVVNSEITQRLGTFFPKDQHLTKFPDLQMTTVDPHDLNQNSLNGRLGSVNDPLVTVWENVTFADNYYQEVASQNALNGRSISGADLNKPLTDYAGFTSDNSSGNPHRNALAWYTGTAHLNKSKLPSDNGELIYRRLGDLERSSSSALTWYTPDHTRANFDHGDENAPWEGIGTGWFYSVNGGGYGKNVRPESNLNQRVRLYEDNTALARMRGDFAVPTLFNGNFDAISERLPRQSIPGWSFYNGANDASQASLVEWREIDGLMRRWDGNNQPNYLEKLGINPFSLNYQPNYALRLEGNQNIIHNRFVVPDWGALRFNLHVPNANGGTLRVSIKGSESHDNWQPLGEIDLRLAEDPASDDPFSVGYYDYANGQYSDPYTFSIAYGTRGFETFNLNVPENLRGKSASLRFDLPQGNSEIYLDDVFFKSAHLKLGNPTSARSFVDTHRENYLIEKPQYALSYNDRTKTPNWVSWQINQTWLGNVDRGELKLKNIPTGYPPNTDFSASVGDEPWVSDVTLPFAVRVEGADLNNSGLMQRGHMVPYADRTRTFKDEYATFMTTNMVPQHRNNNTINSAWQKFESYLHETLVQNKNRELYVIAGGYGYRNNNLVGNNAVVDASGNIVFDSNNRIKTVANSNSPDLSSGETIRWRTNPKEIQIPEYTWKIATVVEPGQGIADINGSTQVIAIITPNRAAPTNGEATLPNRAPVTINNWQHWPNWRVSVRYLEQITGYDFFSNLPKEIQDQIELDDSSALLPPLLSNP